MTSRPPFGVSSHCLTGVRTVGSLVQLFAAACDDVWAGQPRICNGVNVVDPVPGVELDAFVPSTNSTRAGTLVAVVPSNEIENSTTEGWLAAPALMYITVFGAAPVSAIAAVPVVTV